jgi:RNA polymerase sigma-70 factor (ECF subfamily)
MGSIAATERVGASDSDGLVRLAALGDAGAFDVLIATRLDRCYRLAYSILANESDAADATQEAVVSAWRQLPRLRDQRSFEARNALRRAMEAEADPRRGWYDRAGAAAALDPRPPH